MLRLIADWNQNSGKGKQGGWMRRGDKDKGGEGGTDRQRNLFVKNAPLIQEEADETAKIAGNRGEELHSHTFAC